MGKALCKQTIWLRGRDPDSPIKNGLRCIGGYLCSEGRRSGNAIYCNNYDVKPDLDYMSCQQQQKSASTASTSTASRSHKDVLIKPQVTAIIVNQA